MSKVVKDDEMKKEYDFSNAKRGPIVPPEPNKVRITIRLDRGILQWFTDKVNAAGGGNYQTMINNALQEHIASQSGKSLEKSLRRLIREELRERDARMASSR